MRREVNRFISCMAGAPGIVWQSAAPSRNVFWSSQRVCRKTRFQMVRRMRADLFFRRFRSGFPVYLFCFQLLSWLLLPSGSITLPESALLSNSFSFSLLIT
jgi:hypothetical protein